MNRLAFGMATELAPHGVTSIALSPGFMRTELVIAHTGADEASYRDHPALNNTESPRYVGRAVVALASTSAEDRRSKTGKVLRAADLAREYVFETTAVSPSRSSLRGNDSAAHRLSRVRRCAARRRAYDALPRHIGAVAHNS